MARLGFSKRLLVYPPLLVLAALVSFWWFERLEGFTPPVAEERAEAFRSSEPLRPDDADYYSSLDPEPLPLPGINDWLYEMGRADWKGQTVRQWQASPRNPLTAERRTIYVQTWSESPGDLSEIADLALNYLSAFYQLPVRLLTPVQPSSYGLESRKRGKEYQLLAPDLLDKLENELPDDAYCLIALTEIDLYPSDDWNFVFGLASIVDRVGVFSLNRYGPSPLATHIVPENHARIDDRLRERALKIVTHEVGHMFGLRHCIYYKCLMNGTSGLGETDRTPLQVCPICLRKLQLAIGFDLKKRHQDLVTFDKN